jgi:DNA-binding MarR family transcriptional regulator
LIDKLVREGLVARERCAADARVVYAVLTPDGLRRLKAAYPTHLRGVREHLIDRLDTAQMEALAQALEVITEACDHEASVAVDASA